MKAHLKKSVDQYSKIQDEVLINPISQTDAEIITEVIEALKKLDKTDLVAILDGWKYKKDSEVRDDLLQWNIDFNSESNQEEDTKDKEYAWFKKLEGGGYIINGQLYVQHPIFTFITLGDIRYCLEEIFNYSKIEEWDYDVNKMKYGIRLNSHPDESTFKKKYADKKMFFISKEVRDQNYNKLDENFCKLDYIRLVD